MTILRLLLTFTYAAKAGADFVDALAALYVGTRGTAGLPPDLNADLANYYYFTGLQSTTSGARQNLRTVADIRSKRVVRGEDTDLFARVTNNDALATMEIGFECRMLLKMR